MSAFNPIVWTKRVDGSRMVVEMKRMSGGSVCMQRHHVRMDVVEGAKKQVVAAASATGGALKRAQSKRRATPMAGGGVIRPVSVRARGIPKLRAL